MIIDIIIDNDVIIWFNVRMPEKKFETIDEAGPVADRSLIVSPAYPFLYRRAFEKMREVAPLDDDRYNYAFNNGFVPNSTEYRKETGAEGPMLYRTRALLEQLDRFDSLLSIGAGTGEFDGDLAGKMPLQSYCAIEPNGVHVEQLWKNISQCSWEDKHVIRRAFDETTPESIVKNNKFDCVLMTHCAYFMKNPGRAIANARNFTSKHGMVAVLHQTRDGAVCSAFRRFNHNLNLQWDSNVPRQDHGMSTETISYYLKDIGISHYVGEEPAQLFVDDFFCENPLDQEQVELMLNFIMNTPVEQFLQSDREEMVQFIRSLSKTRSSGRKVVDHPQGFIVVPNPESDYAPEGMEYVEA